MRLLGWFLGLVGRLGNRGDGGMGITELRLLRLLRFFGEGDWLLVEGFGVGVG